MSRTRVLDLICIPPNVKKRLTDKGRINTKGAQIKTQFKIENTGSDQENRVDKGYRSAQSNNKEGVQITMICTSLESIKKGRRIKVSAV